MQDTHPEGYKSCFFLLPRLSVTPNVHYMYNMQWCSYIEATVALPQWKFVNKVRVDRYLSRALRALLVSVQVSVAYDNVL